MLRNNCRNMKTFMWSVLGCIPIVFISEPCLAKKALDYIPPPYYLRFIYSLLALAPVALVFCIMAFFAGRFIAPVVLRAKWKSAIIVVVLLVCFGAIYGSLDGHNDEYWNPAEDGAKPLALLLPYLTFLLTRTWIYWKRIIILAVVVPLAYPSTWFCVYLWQMLGESMGLPTTW